MIALFKKMFGNSVSSREKIFNLTTLGGTFAGLASLAVSYSVNIRGYGLWAIGITTVLAMIFFIIGRTTKKYDACLLVVICGINFICFPVLFFTMSGVNGGMLLYFVLGIVLTVISLDLKTSIRIVPFEVAFYMALIYVDYLHPEIAEKFTAPDINKYSGMALDFIVVAFTIAIIVKAIYLSFEKQQKRSEALMDQLQELSIKDTLTKIYNRRFLVSYLENEITRSNRTGTSLSLIMFDIDKFKLINDDFGHLAGDDTLVKFAQILKNNCREYDIVARYGGEEFILVMPDAGIDTAFARADRIREQVSKEHFSDLIDRPITVSGGVALYNPKFKSIEQFIDCADKKLYTAKETGRNKIVKDEL